MKNKTKRFDDFEKIKLISQMIITAYQVELYFVCTYEILICFRFRQKIFCKRYGSIEINPSSLCAVDSYLIKLKIHTHNRYR